MKIKLIMPALVVVIVAELAWLGLLTTRPHANVEILASPKAAHLTIDGAKKVSTGGVFLEPGNHTIKATFPGFADKSTAFKVEEGKPVRVALLLVPNSGSGQEYLTKHAGEQDDREKLGSQQFDIDAGSLQKFYPIISQLPHQGIDFQVDYGKSKKTPDDPYALALYVTVPSTGKEAVALNWIKFSGYNPSDFEIVYQYQDERD